jgi:ATP-binding cassette subfamily F protein 3
VHVAADLALAALDGHCAGVSVLENVMEMRTAEYPLTEEHARAVLGAFLFRKDDVYKPVHVLSGGEKSRLALVRLLVRPPNLLLMDEPTTHLDLASIDALITALKAFEGTLVFISHDVHFIRAVAGKVIHVHSGRVTPYAGGYDYYLEKSKAKGEREALTAGLTDARPQQPRATTPAPAKPAAKPDPKVRKRLEKEVAALETRIASLEAEQAAIAAELQLPATYANPTRAKELNHRLAEVTAAAETATTEWAAKSAELAG